MISIPPYFLLFPFAVFAIGFVFFSLANIISLAKYGARNAVGLLVSFLFLVGTAAIAFYAWNAASAISWTTPVPLFQIQVPSL
jgi:hypothetical protein